VTDDVELAHLLADAADRVSTRWFSPAGIRTTTKADGSPVTEADREVEVTVKSLLGQHRPDDGVLGEEVGPSWPSSGPSRRRWILDGIDGTHNFAAGRTEWGTHIALEEDGEMVLGMVTSPALGRRWWGARGRGAWEVAIADGAAGEPVPLRCNPTSDLDEAVVTAIPSAEHCDGWRLELADELERGGVRPSAFGRSAVRVAAGDSDVAVHLAGGPWDHAVGVAIVEEAGGTFCDLWGGRRIDTGTALFMAPGLRDTVLALVADLRPPTPPPAA
jgi:histidinol-phosphatase